MYIDLYSKTPLGPYALARSLRSSLQAGRRVKRARAGPCRRAPRRRRAPASKMRPFARQPLPPCFGRGDSRGHPDGRLPPGPARRGSARSVRRTPPRVAARVPPPKRPSSARDDSARARARSKHDRPLSRANGAGLGHHRGPLRSERRGQLKSALPCTLLVVLPDFATLKIANQGRNGGGHEGPPPPSRRGRGRTRRSQRARLLSLDAPPSRASMYTWMYRRV